MDSSNWFRRHLTKIIVFVALLLVTLVAVVRVWYVVNLRQVSVSSVKVEYVIAPGASVGQIANKLAENGLIRNTTAFKWYVKGEGEKVVLQAGTYSLSPSMDTPEIVDIIANGRVSTKLVTLLPAKRLDETRLELIKIWDEEEVDAALKPANYSSHPLLVNLPNGRTLEGYIFPDSYQISSSTTAKQLIKITLDTFYNKIQKKGLEEKLKKHGLNLHEAITLASIVEEETGNETDKPRIAQVFLKRLRENIKLGSDVTFIYAARISGKPERVDIDSPYNTRLYAGLPPGPIANFTISSLEAVATPAKGDYLFFVAGDDGITRFSKTLAEHNAYVAKYCQVGCR